MNGWLVRTGLVLVGLCSLTGCEGCDKKKPPEMPVTERRVAPDSGEAAARPAVEARWL